MAAGFEPHIWFAEGTTWTDDNPGRAIRERSDRESLMNFPKDGKGIGPTTGV